MRIGDHQNMFLLAPQCDRSVYCRVDNVHIFCFSRQKFLFDCAKMTGVRSPSSK